MSNRESRTKPTNKTLKATPNLLSHLPHTEDVVNSFWGRFKLQQKHLEGSRIPNLCNTSINGNLPYSNLNIKKEIFEGKTRCHKEANRRETVPPLRTIWYADKIVNTPELVGAQIMSSACAMVGGATPITCYTQPAGSTLFKHCRSHLPSMTKSATEHFWKDSTCLHSGPSPSNCHAKS